MKFNVVIGNPPYQGEDGQSQIYPKFGINAANLTKQHTCLIIPTRWYNGYTEEMKKFRQTVINEGLVSIDDYTNAEDVFENVQIMGGVCYYHTDKKHIGDCRITNHRKSGDSTSVREAIFEVRNNSGEIERVIVRDNCAIQILQKVHTLDTFDYYVQTKDIFKLSSTDKGSDIQNNDAIPVYITGNSHDYRGGTVRFFDRSKVTDDFDLVNKHKVLLYAASDNMLSFPFKVLNKPLYAAPGIACNQSFIVCGPFKTEEICHNVISYLCTKFVRSLIHIRKMSQNTSADVYKLVPIQDFNHAWTDQMLYEKYGLTEEEKEYIETNFKEL